MGADGRCAAASQPAKEGPLRRSRHPRGGIVDCGQERKRSLVVGTALPPRTPRPGSGKVRLGLEPLGDSLFEPQPPDPGSGEHGRVVRTAEHLVDAGVDIAADRAYLEIRPQRMQLSLAAEAARSDNGSSRKIGERETAPGNEAVARVFPHANCTNHDAGRFVRREILERVNGEVDLALTQRAPQLGSEEALPPDLGKRLPARLSPVALRLHQPDVALQAGPGDCEEVDDTVGLNASELRGP